MEWLGSRYASALPTNCPHFSMLDYTAAYDKAKYWYEKTLSSVSPYDPSYNEIKKHSSFPSLDDYTSISKISSEAAGYYYSVSAFTNETPSDKSKFFYDHTKSRIDKANKNDAKAQIEVINVLRSGIDPCPDKEKYYFLYADKFYNNIKNNPDIKINFRDKNIGITTLAQCYLNGWGTSRDIDKALKLYSEIEINPKTKCAYLEHDDTQVLNKIDDAVLELMQEAENNNVEAQLDLAKRFAEGNGIPFDCDMAKYWWEEAAEDGSIEGAHFSALTYYANGRDYYNCLAVKNSSEGDLIKNIDIFSRPKDVSKNSKETILLARYWYEKEALRGNVEAMKRAFFSFKEFDIPRNYISSEHEKLSLFKNKELALKYINMAVDAGDIEAKIAKAAYITNDPLTLEQERFVKEALEEGYDKQMPLAKYYLGLAYATGTLGFPFNPEKAREMWNDPSLYEEETRLGCKETNLDVKNYFLNKSKDLYVECFAKSYKSLGECDKHADENEQNIEKINGLITLEELIKLRENAEQGNSLAAINLAKTLIAGIDITRLNGFGDNATRTFAPIKSEAIKIFQKLAQEGNAEAMLNLGYLYQKGDIFSKDETKAKEYFQLAADNGSPTGLFELGKINKDYELIKKAAELKSGKALAYLGHKIYKLNDPKEIKEAIEMLKEAANLYNLDGMLDLADIYEKGLGIEKNNIEAVKWLIILMNKTNSKDCDAMKIMERINKEELMNGIRAACSYADKYFNIDEHKCLKKYATTNKFFEELF